jgi:hypothetical protein
MYMKKQGKAREDVYYVHGSGLVPVPEARLFEIPYVIEEHHERERQQEARSSLRRFL